MQWEVAALLWSWEKKKQKSRKTSWFEVCVLASRPTPPTPPHPPGEMKQTSFCCNGSIFCPYLRPSADSVPGRCPCQEEVCTQGGSCPGWPYLERRDKHHDTVRKQDNSREKINREKERGKKEDGRHQTDFTAARLKTPCECGGGLGLFQEMHCTSLLLHLFVLIDKKLKQFFFSKSRTSSLKLNRKDGCVIFFFSFFLFLYLWVLGGGVKGASVFWFVCFC